MNIYEMFQYGRQATPGLSSDFILSTAPAIAQEMKGSTFGRGVAAFNRAIVGGRMDNRSMIALQQLGLVDANDLDRKHRLKSGSHIAGWDIAQSNPYTWVKDYMLPAMQAHGIVTDATRLAKIGELFSNSVGAELVGILANQQSKIDKNHSMIHDAKGLTAGNEAIHTDPTLAWNALKSSIEGLAAYAGRDMAAAIAPPMANLAGAIAGYTAELQRRANYRNDHPGAPTLGQQAANRGLNRVSIGLDSTGSYGDLPDAAILDAKYRHRRDYLDAAARTAAGKGDGWDTFAKVYNKVLGRGGPTSGDPAKDMAELDQVHDARVLAQERVRDNAARLRGVERMASLPEGPSVPGIKIVSPSGHSVFAAGPGNYANVDPTTGLPTGYQAPGYTMAPRPTGAIVGPSLDPPKAPPIDLGAILNGKIEANARISFDQPAPVSIDVRVTADPSLKAAVEGAKQLTLRAHAADTGVSMPEASPNGKMGHAD